MQHLQKQKQQQLPPSFHVSGQKQSRENISQQVRQVRAFQKAGQELRGCRLNPAITNVVSSEDLASASKLNFPPFHRLDVGDELVPQIAVNQECLDTCEERFLSQSAPECSLRVMMAKDTRSNSVPSKNLLMVPKWEWAVPLATFSSDKSGRCSSAQDLSSVELLRQSYFQPIWRAKSCEREGFLNVQHKPFKKSNMAEPLSAVLRWIGLSPRNSPSGSRANSRSPSPGSHSCRSSSLSPSLSPVGSPLFSSNMMTIRPLHN